MEPLSLALITVVVFLTSFTGASVGGGLIVTPLMIALGVPPSAAVAVKRVSLLGATP